ncbi:hypothetical protein [Nostoc sp. PA-18-2419]|uniref:hypothetical protein n=1 Tax=Nostoc sp. PA-18-2419 TaxID=2575443 RepID=UPI001108CB12|nr:hypothetical protein [Nostoc sp. PA-18-2419]
MVGTSQAAIANLKQQKKMINPPAFFLAFCLLPSAFCLLPFPMKTIESKLYPTVAQAQTINLWLQSLKWIWNQGAGTSL